MAEYHVGCGMAGIYAGTVKPNKPDEWKNKSCVTEEALLASALYLLGNGKSFVFKLGEKRYLLDVTKLEFLEQEQK